MSDFILRLTLLKPVCLRFIHLLFSESLFKSANLSVMSLFILMFGLFLCCKIFGSYFIH